MGPNLPTEVPFAVVYPLAAVLDGLALVLNKSFPVSRVRIKKFCANSQFSAARVLAAGFEPKYDLREALQQTIRAEFPS